MAKKKPPELQPKRPRGRPKKSSLGKVAELQLRDLLKQLEADSPPVESAAALVELKTLRGPVALRLIASGEAVLISRGMLRRIIESLKVLQTNKGKHDQTKAGSETAKAGS